MSTTTRREPAWDTVRPARRGQAPLILLGLLGLLLGLAATALRIGAPTDDSGALLASFVPYGVLGYALATLLLGVALLRARRRVALAVLLVAAVAGLGYSVSTLLPFFVPDGRPATTRSFTVFSLNMRHGSADVQEVTAEAQAADVVVLVEATPDAVSALEGLGWRVRFPYASGATMAGGNGSVVFSRYPLSDTSPLPQTSFQQWAVTVEVPQLGPVRLLAVHPCNPYCGRNAFRREHEVLRSVVRSQEDLPLVVAGDFNAVDDHAPMRRLYADGLRSATDVAGAGWLPTYPANTVLPPLLPIDHVLINSQLTATSVGTVRIDGTDHLGVRAVLAGSG